MALCQAGCKCLTSLYCYLMLCFINFLILKFLSNYMVRIALTINAVNYLNA